MADIRSPGLLYVKGLLFLGVGVAASALLLLEHPSARVTLLLALAVWAFARAYYFAFYVVEHDIDGRYQFSKLWPFARYLPRQATSHEARRHP